MGKTRKLGGVGEPDERWSMTERIADPWGDLTPFGPGEEKPEEPDRLYHELFDEVRQGSLGLLRDLQDLYLMAHFCDITWTMIGQAAQGARDRELLEVVETCEGETATQIKWLKTRMKQAAPQVLLVAS
jgi:hypothetical protein